MMKKRKSGGQAGLEQQQKQQQQQDFHPSPSTSPAASNVAPPSPASDPSPMLWEERSLCLGPILRHNSLPLVVRCEKRGMNLENVSGFDFTQPLMLHTRRNVRKVVAASLQHVRVVSSDGIHQEGEMDSGGSSGGSAAGGCGGGGGTRLKEVGDHLLIPEDYKGWFAILGPLEDVTAEKVVPHFRQVALLALSNCESFLVGGKEPVAAVQMPSPGMGGNSCVQPRLIYPGDVLRMGKIYVGESTKTVKKMFGGKRTVKKEEKFLLCMDDKDREVYLPVENRGTFYVLTTEGHGAPKIPIMRMPDICTRFRFPTVVKLLFGCVPATPCAFTGTMVLLDSRMESSVIGCTMVNAHNILLDIPIDSDLRFFVAHHTHDLLASRCYKNAKTLCHDKASTYMRNMKVAYYIDGDEAGGLGDDTVVDSEVGGRGVDRGRRGAEGMETKISTSSAPTTPSRRSNSVSDSFLSRSVSCTQPSIVEEQELFCPPETKTSESPKMQTPVGSRKAGRKSVDVNSVVGGNVGSNSSDPHRQFHHSNSASPSVSTNSPTVLRKDQQFYLPEQLEVLLLKHATSVPALSGNEKRPLPPVVHRPPADDTLPNGHYMTMEESTDDQRPGSRKPPDLPARCHSSGSMNIYTQAWDGETLGGDTQVQDVDETFDQTTSSSDSSSPPALRPKKLRVPEIAHRVSSFAFDNTFLTVPVFRSSGDGTHTTSAPITARSEVTSTSSSTQGSDYLTPCQTMPRPSSETVGDNRMDLSPSATQPGFSGESHLALSPPPPTTDQQPYETMSLMTRTVAKQGANAKNYSEYTHMSIVTNTAPKQGTSTVSDSQYAQMSAVDQQRQGAVGERGISSKLPPKPPTPCSPYYNIHSGFLGSKPLPPCPPLPPLPSSLDSQAPAAPPPQHQIQFVNMGLSDSSVPWSEFSSAWSSGDRKFEPQASATNSDQSPGQLDGRGSVFPGRSLGEYQEMTAPVADARASPEQHNRDLVERDQQQDTSYIYYEGYDPVVSERGERSSVSKEEVKSEQVPREKSSSLATVSEESTLSEVTLYENVQNIRPYNGRPFHVSCSAPCLASSDDNNNSSSKTNNHHSEFFDKFANPPAIFNYVSPPPPRPVTPQKPPIPKKPAKLVKPNTFVSNNSNAVGMATVAAATTPPPPTPCGVSQQRVNDGYLHACEGSTENSPAGLPHRDSNDSVNCTVPLRFSQGSVGRDIAEELTRDRNVAMNAVSQASGVWSGDDLDASSYVSEDDLPLGASFDNFRLPVAVSDSGCAGSSVAGPNRTTREGQDKGARASNSRGVDDVSSLSVAGLCEALKSVGLATRTIETLRQKKVDGTLLLSLSEEELKDALPDVKILDFKKIRMFLNGWRPMD